MSVLLRIASVLSLVWAAGLYLLPASAIAGGEVPACAALTNGLAAANLGFAYLFWRAAANPAAERGAIYTALLLFGLRAANGTYEVLYRLEGRAAGEPGRHGAVACALRRGSQRAAVYAGRPRAA